MSVHVLSACWALDLPTSEKFVLISLADQSNDAGLCWPAVATIANRTGLKPRTVQRCLAALEGRGLVHRRVHFRDGRQLTNWYRVVPGAEDDGALERLQGGRHRITPPLTHDHPPPDTGSPRSVTDPLQEPERETRAGPKRFSPPSVEEVRAYCESRGNGVDAQTFVDHYTAKGWVVGKSPMRDWKAAVRTWERRHNGNGGGSDAAHRRGGGQGRTNQFHEQYERDMAAIERHQSRGGGTEPVLAPDAGRPPDEVGE